MKLHPKVLELRNKVGESPIKFSKAVHEDRSAKAKSDYDNRIIRQYHCIWDVPDDYGTIPTRGMWGKSINERGPASKAKYKITALYAHSMRDSVGLPNILEEDEVGLFSEVPILEGIQVCDELLIRHRAGVMNNGSYGFNYVWDKMEYDEKLDGIRMLEVDGLEITYCTIGAQQGTYGVRDANGVYTDQYLDEETEALIKKVPRADQLELRLLIDRHITLALNKPLEERQKALDKGKPQQVDKLDIDYLISKISKK